MRKQSVGTLADKIAGILNTAPSSFDPEDDAVDATNAQISYSDVEDTYQEDEILSQFRRKNIDLLADLDETYAGKKTSRKNLRGASNSDDISSSEGSNSSENDVDIDDFTNKYMEKQSSQNTVSKLNDILSGDDEETEASEDDDIQSGSEDDHIQSGSEDDDTESSDYEEIEESNASFKHIKDANVPNQIKKGICVRNQMAMWEKLLEVRIQLQKCLVGSNKMPQSITFTEIKHEAGPEFSNKVNETKNKLCDMLNKLLLLQKLLLKQFPETNNLDQQNEIAVNKYDMENAEILSDTDTEQCANEEGIAESEEPERKKRKLEHYEHEISNQHKTYTGYRNSVIQKWNDKTRVVLKGGTTPHSVLDQIGYNLSNKDKLLKRTQLKRSQYSILGKDEISDDKGDEEYNAEIFDDDDFYHQLLRELIEVKSADVTDPVQLGRQWIQLQNLRSKMKRKIDTRATKGRKIRYTIHSKLVNFMAPIDDNLWTDEARNELYNSLFGRNQTV